MAYQKLITVSLLGRAIDKILTELNKLQNACGPYMFDVTADGHLIMYYEDGVDPDSFSVDNNGHLIMTFTT